MVDIGAIVGSGFRLIGRRPWAVLAWAAVLFFGGLLTLFVQSQLLPANLTLELEAMRAGQGAGLPVFGFGSVVAGLTLGLVSLVISTVVTAAAMRAWLFPEDTAFASLKLGGDELRMVGLSVLIYLLAIAASVLAVLGLIFLVSASGFATGGNSLASIAIGLLLGFALFLAMIFVLVRLSLIFPLVMLRRRIGIDESWERTRGHFWPLLGAYVLLMLITIAAALIVELPLLAATAPAASDGASSLTASVAADLAAGRISPGIWWLLPILFVSSLLNALLVALWSAAVSEATIQRTSGNGAAAPGFH